jgi:hypothetical protein
MCVQECLYGCVHRGVFNIFNFHILYYRGNRLRLFCRFSRFSRTKSVSGEGFKVPEFKVGHSEFLFAEATWYKMKGQSERGPWVRKEAEAAMVYLKLVFRHSVERLRKTTKTSVKTRHLPNSV